MLKLNKTMTALGVVVATIVGYASVASAQTPTTEETVEGGFADLQALFTGTIAVAMFALVIAIVAVVMGIRWLRKGASA